MSLDGRVVLVTGASRGLGRSMAMALSQDGAAVYGIGRDRRALAEVADEARRGGARFTPKAGDVTSEAEMTRIIGEVVEQEGRLDVAFANAGVADFAPAASLSLERWETVIATNLTGTFLTFRACGRQMLAQGHGKLIAVASEVGLRGAAGLAAYAASKGGTIAYAKSLAWEWAPSVTVNVVAPGPFETEMTKSLRRDVDDESALLGRLPLRRWGRAEEIGPLAVFLAGPESDFMTGSVIAIDGGMKRS